MAQSSSNGKPASPAPESASTLPSRSDDNDEGHPGAGGAVSTSPWPEWTGEVRNGMQRDRATEATDRAHRADAIHQMRMLWGPDYQVNITRINRYLNQLPDADRQRIESSTLPDGRLQLNDPEYLQQLAVRARTVRPASGLHPADELAAIEHAVRTNRKAYNKSPELQSRFRELLAGNAQAARKPIPDNYGAIEREISELEGFMRSNRSAWLKNQGKQARYLALIQRREDLTGN